MLLGVVEAYLDRCPVGLGPNARPDIGPIRVEIASEDAISLTAQGVALSLEEAVVFALGGADPV